MSKSKYDGSTLASIGKRVEDGVVFEASSRLSIANAGGVGKWLFRTGSKRVVIIARCVTSNGDELTYQAFKAPTLTSDGTPVAIGNRNGDSNNLPTVKMFSAPTTTDNGIGIAPVYMPGSTGVGQITDGQFTEDGFVRILKTHTDYLLTLANDGSANPANGEVYILWAELTDPAPFQG
jgi:hypothetical protein